MQLLHHTDAGTASCLVYSLMHTTTQQCVTSSWQVVQPRLPALSLAYMQQVINAAARQCSMPAAAAMPPDKACGSP